MESEKAERSKMRYPKGRMVVVRDSTVAISLNNNSGAVLLSTLLFWYDNPHKYDTYDEKEQTFTMCRTQAEIEEQACNQIDVKTIHRTAVPLLQLLSYLTVKEKMNGNIYILHMDRIFAAYAAYEESASALKNFLKASLQLDSCPIKIPESQLDSCLINRTPVYLQLDSVLIRNRQESNCKRGRKPKPQDTSEAISEDTENLREYRENSNEKEGTGEQTDTTTSAPSLSLDASLSSPPQSIDSETHSQQGDADASLPPGSADRVDTVPTPGMGDIPASAQDIRPLLPVHRPVVQAEEAAPEIDEDFCTAETEHRLPAIPKTSSLPPAVEPGRSGGPTPVAPAPLPGLTSHEQSHDATPPRSVAVGCPGDRDSHDLGAVASAPTPRVPSEVTPPRTMRATVVSPPPQVLVVSQQFTSVEDWKQAQEAFVEQLRGIWKTASSDFKRQAGNWNAYRKQYLDRWMRANPEPAEVQFTDDGKTLFDEWCSLFKARVDAGKANTEAANWLAERLAPWVEALNLSRAEVLRDFKGWCYTNDKKGYYTRGVKLFDLKREFEGWQSYQQSLLDKAEREKSRPQNKYGTVSGLPRLEIDPEWLEAMEGR